jgi:hypothetical protein
MQVESCASAIPLARAAIEGKGYTERQKQAVEMSAEHLFVVRARQVADVDILQWHSAGSIHWYRGPSRPIDGDGVREYLVTSFEGCEALLTKLPRIYDVNPDPPCRDSVAAINGQAVKETDARVLTGLPEASYFPDQETLESLDAARGRLKADEVRPSAAKP